MSLTHAEKQAAYKERQVALDPAAWQAKCREGQARFRKNHPEKKSAWNKVYKAVRSGRLIRPKHCARCEVACRPQASHDDYSRPLEVEWLCHSCHAIKDTQIRRMQ